LHEQVQQLVKTAFAIFIGVKPGKMKSSHRNRFIAIYNIKTINSRSWFKLAVSQIHFFAGFPELPALNLR